MIYMERKCEYNVSLSAFLKNIIFFKKKIVLCSWLCVNQIYFMKKIYNSMQKLILIYYEFKTKQNIGNIMTDFIIKIIIIRSKEIEKQKNKIRKKQIIRKQIKN